MTDLPRILGMLADHTGSDMLESTMLLFSSPSTTSFELSSRFRHPAL